MLPKGNSFPKAERLCGRNQIKHLFQAGASFFQYPFKVIYTTQVLVVEDDFHLPQLLVSVGKRNFKKAVDRNKIKRQTKEAYRLQRKSYLLQPKGLEKRIFINSLCLLYTEKQILPYEKMASAVEKCLQRLAEIDQVETESQPGKRSDKK